MRGPWGGKQITIHISNLNCPNNRNTTPLLAYIYISIYVLTLFSCFSWARPFCVLGFVGRIIFGVYNSVVCMEAYTMSQISILKMLLKQHERSGAWGYKFHVKQWELLWHFLPKAFRKPQNISGDRTDSVDLRGIFMLKWFRNEDIKRTQNEIFCDVLRLAGIAQSVMWLLTWYKMGQGGRKDFSFHHLVQHVRTTHPPVQQAKVLSLFLSTMPRGRIG